jgi:hypothetical protein
MRAARFRAFAIAVLIVLAPVRADAAHSFEYVAEHLPEAAMDNRFATLPLFAALATPAPLWQFTVQGAAARTEAGNLALDGPMFSVGVRRRLDERWSVHGFAFSDNLQFSGAREQRPLDVLFTKTPLALPAEALFTNLHGTSRNNGAGLAFEFQDHGWPGERRWFFGALYQRVSLRDYRATYEVLEGPSMGATGFVDYSAEYTHVTPITGLSLPHEFGAWNLAPHAVIAWPIPQRGLEGRITGPGFDVSGDTGKAGNGKHFGDFSLTLGLDATYVPWGLSVDIGTLATQAVFERVAHKGIEQNWVVSASLRF